MTKTDYAIVYDYIKSNLLETVTFSKFRSCHCFISDDTVTVNGKNYTLIKSYKTFVAFVDIENEVFIEIGKFSSTTSKQCTQIYNAYFRDFERINCGCDIDFYKYDYGTF